MLSILRAAPQHAQQDTQHAMAVWTKRYQPTTDLQHPAFPARYMEAPTARPGLRGGAAKATARGPRSRGAQDLVCTRY